jgi:hypothetical protein
LARYCMGGGDAHDALTLPLQNELENRAAMCRFSFADLEQLTYSSRNAATFHSCRNCSRWIVWKIQFGTTAIGYV